MSIAMKTESVSRLAAVRTELDEARRARARLGEEARAFQREVQLAEAGLDHLARTAPDQFADGQPKPKTEAAKLKAKLEEAKTSRWPSILDGADERIVAKERELAKLIRDNASELATAEYEAGLEEVQRVRSLALELRGAIAQVKSHEPSLLTITSALGGVFDGRDVWVDPHLAEIERVLGGVDELQPARIAALTPFTDEEPRVVRTVDGWVPAR